MEIFIDRETEARGAVTSGISSDGSIILKVECELRSPLSGHRALFKCTRKLDMFVVIESLRS